MRFCLQIQTFTGKKSALTNLFYNKTVREWNILKVEVKLAPPPAAFEARMLKSSKAVLRSLTLRDAIAQFAYCHLLYRYRYHRKMGMQR